MKLIGVTGKSGAGKTTFSNILAEKNNIGVIHVDDIIKKIKLKYLSFLATKEIDVENKRINPKLKIFIFKNKFFFNMYMRFRAKMIEKFLDLEIQKFKNEGKEFVIIDDIYIKYHKIYDDLSKVFIIERNYVERQHALKKRDNITKEELIARDMAHFNGNYKEITLTDNSEKVLNNGTEEELRIKVNNIYNKHFITFKEKYRQDVSDISKKVERNNDNQLNITRKKEERD